MTKNAQKTCDNCKFIGTRGDAEPCFTCLDDKSYPNWTPIFKNMAIKRKVIEKKAEKNCGTCHFHENFHNQGPCDQCFDKKSSPHWKPKNKTKKGKK